MSRYSYKVEKLLKEIKSPSLDILLEEEGEEETPASDPSDSSSEDKDEGIPDDAFADEDDNKNSESDDLDSEDDGTADEEEKTSKSLSSDVERLQKYFSRSQKAGENISDASHEYKGISDAFFDDIDRLVMKADQEQVENVFETKSYSSQSIKGFLFEEEKDSQENIESSIANLEKKLNSKENQLPNPLDLAKVSYKYFERFDEVDRAIYIIKLVSKYFKRFVNPDKDKVFDEFLDRFLDILQEKGVNIELNGLEAIKYNAAAGARSAG